MVGLVEKHSESLPFISSPVLYPSGFIQSPYTTLRTMKTTKRKMIRAPKVETSGRLGLGFTPSPLQVSLSERRMSGGRNSFGSLISFS
jgi:hypothetical protein